ncbi:hypothetical protein [Streptomyces sp. NPDC127197]|uniref:hypothetical protein n=1 Tax=Streptomyces sp. NPDC127197 TaxID=3345388 RepID=UPI0036444112
MREIARRIAAAAGHGDDRAARLLAETAATANACAVDPAGDLGLGRPHFPEPAVVGAPAAPSTPLSCCVSAPRPASSAAASTETSRARRRLEEELAVIRTLQYDTYFLTVAPVVADVLWVRISPVPFSAAVALARLLGQRSETNDRVSEPSMNLPFAYAPSRSHAGVAVTKRAQEYARGTPGVRGAGTAGQHRLP